MRGILITVQTSVTRLIVIQVVQPVDIAPDDPGGVLRSMYDLLQCTTVDAVRLADDLTMWVDDEGLYTGQVNPLASYIANQLGFRNVSVFGGPESYYGAVLFLGGADPAGNTTGLTEQRERWMFDITRKIPHRLRCPKNWVMVNPDDLDFME